ncbi:MAG: small multi-drug export protein [Nanoarchaeota archaeon]|nr:small multi-drug export protein [Nanoarchaeota archaeon]
MISDVLSVAWITLLPFLELRASIPYGIVTGMNMYLVFFIACVVNILLGLVLYPFVGWLVRIGTRISLVDRLYQRYVVKVQKKLHALTERYGEWAIAAFIAVPLPGSGVYSGALAAYLIGLEYRKFLVACIVGVLIAGVLVTLISVSGVGAALFLKQV